VGECPPQKDIFYLEINNAEQNGYLKLVIVCFWGNDGRGGLVTLQSLSTIKKGTSHSDFQSNEPFSNFLRQLLRYEVPRYGEEKINNTLSPHHSLPRQCYRPAYDKVSLFYVCVFS
jgi:hypothetical protein